ncbi:MAG: copper chaperone PCu(A)C [Maritimibacter sp.]
MSFKRTFIAATMAASFALPAFAGSEISIEDAYARSSGMTAMAGAAFFAIHNTGDEDDRLVAASSDVAKMVQLHTHIIDDDGVAKMREVPDGFPVPAGGDHMLARGGDHVMFMGLKAPMNDGDIVHVVLTFEKAGDIALDIPVDLNRDDAMTMSMDSMAGGMSGDMDADMDGDMESDSSN